MRSSTTLPRSRTTPATSCWSSSITGWTRTPSILLKNAKNGMTYAAPLYVTARLFNKQTGEVKEQEIFMGDFPLMTDAGTFISNGAERAIVSQLVRSPGVFYGSSKDRTGKDLFTATMNPNRGAWLEYETDSSDVYYVRIDKNRKLPVTTLLRALGLSTDEQIKQFFGDSEPKINASLEKDITHNTEEGLLEVYRKLRPGEPPTVENSRAHLNNLFFDPRRYDLARFGRYKMNNKLRLTRRIAGYRAAEDIIAPLTGELLAAKGEKINMAKAEEIDNAGVPALPSSLRRRARSPVRSLSSPTAASTPRTSSASTSRPRPVSMSAPTLPRSARSSTPPPMWRSRRSCCARTMMF